MPRRVGRRYLIDVVMQTPQRFSDAFRAAVELVTLPGMGHDLPRLLWPTIISNIRALADRWRDALCGCGR